MTKLTDDQINRAAAHAGVAWLAATDAVVAAKDLHYLLSDAREGIAGDVYEIAVNSRVARLEAYLRKALAEVEAMRK